MQTKFIIGDCIKKLPKLKSNSIDVVITSPPYNLNIKYDKYIDKQPNYLKFMRQVAKQLFRVIKNEGSVFINVGGSSVQPLLPFQLQRVFSKYFVLQNSIIWVKSIAVDEITHGHFKPINSNRFVNLTHEHIFHFTKSGKVAIDRLGVGVPFSDKSNLARRGHKQDLRCAGSVWFIRYQTKNSKADTFHHPASYPVELPLRTLKLHGKKHPVVLDPFLGTGSTGVAAKQYGAKRFIGMDISSDYIKISRQRIIQGLI